MKYPELHPTLAIDSSIVKYDVRLPPKEGIAHPTFHGVRTAFALAKVSFPTYFQLDGEAHPSTARRQHSSDLRRLPLVNLVEGKPSSTCHCRVCLGSTL
jgi:hypothetical protein